MLFAVTTRGFARNSASESSFNKRIVTDIAGAERIASWPLAARSNPPMPLCPLRRKSCGENVPPVVLVWMVGGDCGTSVGVRRLS